MTFSYTPADSPAIWMQFVPARENTAPPAEEDNRLTEGIVHTGMSSEATTVDTEEKRAEEEVSNVAEDIFENGVSAKGVGPHIRSVDQESQLHDSQLTEREYHRECISVGKEQADGLSDDSFDFSSLTTTTDRGRDAVVVGLRKSAGQSGSPVDCIVSKHDTDNLPKEFCVVASGTYGKKRRNAPLCHPKIDRLPGSQAKSGARYSCRAVGDKHLISSAKDAPVSRPGCWHQIDDDIARKKLHPSCADAGNQEAPWPCESAIYRATAPQTCSDADALSKNTRLCDSGKWRFLRQRVTLSCQA